MCPYNWNQYKSQHPPKGAQERKDEKESAPSCDHQQELGILLSFHKIWGVFVWFCLFLYLCVFVSCSVCTFWGLFLVATDLGTDQRSVQRHHFRSRSQLLHFAHWNKAKKPLKPVCVYVRKREYVSSSRQHCTNKEVTETHRLKDGLKMETKDRTP